MVLYSIIISAINTKDNIEDKIELNQQAEEMEYHIKNIVENSINIINITTTDNEVIETLQENKKESPAVCFSQSLQGTYLI